MGKKALRKILRHFLHSNYFLFILFIVQFTSFNLEFPLQSFSKSWNARNRMITYTNPYKHNFQFCESYVAARSRWLILQLFRNVAWKTNRFSTALNRTFCNDRGRVGSALLCLKTNRYYHVSCVTCMYFPFADQAQKNITSNVTVIPAWKRDLAEKRKQRVAVNGVQTSNKKNEPKTTPEVPQWKKEFAERRKRRDMSPSQVQPDKRDRSPETPEWQRRLANTRRTQPNVVTRGPVEDSTDQVPSFMKEFERKKRTLPRGRYFTNFYLYVNFYKVQGCK